MLRWSSRHGVFHHQEYLAGVEVNLPVAAFCGFPLVGYSTLKYILSDNRRFIQCCPGEISADYPLNKKLLSSDISFSPRSETCITLALSSFTIATFENLLSLTTCTSFFCSVSLNDIPISTTHRTVTPSAPITHGTFVPSATITILATFIARSTDCGSRYCDT